MNLIVIITLLLYDPRVSLRRFQHLAYLSAMKFPKTERVASRLICRDGRRDASSYRYSPVNKEASEIRLVTLLPGALGARLRITIRITVLSKTLVPEYEALSYAWGSAKRTTRVYIQDAEGGRESTLNITQNLAEALQELRYQDKPRTLWIDAICVDQSNIPERGHQVIRMADIYPQASRVVVWVGPERHDSAFVIRELVALGSTVEVHWDGPIQIKPLSGRDHDQWLNEPLPVMKDFKSHKSLWYFLNRPWFTRLWIWQEIRLAKKNAELLCGRESMSWDTFRTAIMCLSNKRHFLPSFLAIPTQQVTEICNYRPSLDKLDFLLCATRYARCSDERDRIYSLLNLSYDFETEPDYSKTTEDVFKSVVIGCASTRKNLTILRHCEMRKKQESSLPSWVPNWTLPIKCIRLEGSKNYLTTNAQFRCIGENVLVVNGCLVATLDSITKIIPPTSSFSSRTAQLRKIIRKLMRGKTKDDSYVAGGFIIDALCRILCGGTFAEDWLPLEPIFPKFHESKEYVRNLMEFGEPVEPSRFIDRVIEMVRSRAVFQTGNGYIGLGPDSIKSRDQVYVILGCEFPLILRPSDTESHRVVGECYIDGFMESEALLGALPENWHYVSHYLPDLNKNSNFDVLKDTQTGEIQAGDPRLGSLPVGWCIVDHHAKHIYNRFSNAESGVDDTILDPRLSPEALKARGVSLQEIRLI